MDDQSRGDVRPIGDKRIPRERQGGICPIEETWGISRPKMDERSKRVWRLYVRKTSWGDQGTPQQDNCCVGYGRSSTQGVIAWVCRNKKEEQREQWVSREERGKGAEYLCIGVSIVEDLLFCGLFLFFFLYFPSISQLIQSYFSILCVRFVQYRV